MMKRKILPLLLVVALLSTVFVIFGAFSVSADAVEITSLDHITDANGSYILADNIVLTEGNTTMSSFSGTLDGNGKTISGITAPLFEALSGTVKNLTLEGSIDFTGSTNVGTFANTSTGTISGCVSNVTISNTTKTTSATVVGGIVGTATGGTIEKTENNGAITVLLGCDGEKDNAIGGLVGKIGACNITSCVNSGNIFVDAGEGNTADYKGGAGGIVGQTTSKTKQTITMTVNSGEVKARATKFGIAGIIGRTHTDSGSNPTVTYCANVGNIIKTEDRGERAAGIISYVKGATVEWCYNLGDITTEGSSRGAACGLLGYFNSGDTTKLNNCYTVGTVSGSSSYALININGTNNFSSSNNFWVTTGVSLGWESNKSNLNGTGVADKAALNEALLALSDTAYCVDPAINNGYAILTWQCPHTNVTTKCNEIICDACGTVTGTTTNGSHDFENGTWSVYREADAINDGEERRYCANGCGTHDETRAIPATGTVTPVDGVYHITNEAQMLWVAYYLNSGAVSASSDVSIDADITLTNGMTHISKDYTGEFNGNGHTISGINCTMFNQFKGVMKNLTIEGAIHYSTCGTTDNGKIRRLAAISYFSDFAVMEGVKVDVDIVSSANDLNGGGFFGYNGGDITFIDCEYAGDYVMNWSGTKGSNGGGGIGGFIGWGANTVKFDNCKFTGKVSVVCESDNALNGKTIQIGGFVGAGSGTYTLTNCESTGTVSADLTLTKGLYIGGFFGNSSGSKNTIENSRFTGNITVKAGADTGDSTTTAIFVACGGFVGKTGKIEITNSVANFTGDYSGIENCGEGRFGGFVGGADSDFTITNSVNAGKLATPTVVEGTTDLKAGSFVGYAHSGLTGKFGNCGDICADNAGKSLLGDYYVPSGDETAVSPTINTTNSYAYNDVKTGVSLFDGAYIQYNFGLVESATNAYVERESINDKFAVYLSTKANGTDAHDARIVVLANLTALSDISSAKLLVTFKLNGEAVQTRTLILGGSSEGAVLEMYGAVDAAGVKYFAAEGYAYFGTVITGIPNSAYDTVTAVIVEEGNEDNVLLSEVGTLSPYVMSSASATKVKLDNTDALTKVALSFVLDADTYASVKAAADSGVTNTWTVNFGTAVASVDKTAAVFDDASCKVTITTESGIATVRGNNVYSDMALKIKASTSLITVDLGTNVYYSTYAADADRVGSAVAGLSAISGPNPNHSSESYKSILDNSVDTKLCTNERTALIFQATSAVKTTGISLVTANDNASNSGQNYRVVNSFKVYGATSNLGANDEGWVEIQSVTAADMSHNNYTENYYAISDAGEYQYYKVVFGDSNLFQFSELWLFTE